MIRAPSMISATGNWYAFGTHWKIFSRTCLTMSQGPVRRFGSATPAGLRRPAHENRDHHQEADADNGRADAHHDIERAREVRSKNAHLVPQL